MDGSMVCAFSLEKRILHEGESIAAENGFFYVIAGSVSVHEGEKRWSVKSGGSGWIRGKAMLVDTCPGFCSFYLVSFRQAPALLETVWQSPSKICPLFDEMRSLQQRMEIDVLFKKQSLLFEIFSHVLNKQETDDICAIADQIEQQLADPLSVEELASRAGMTATSFARAFRRKIGKSPKEFLNDKRIEKAKVLIVQQPSITIKEAAHQIGLQDEFYFSRLFKKREGISPRQFAKKIKPRVAVVSQFLLQDHLLALGIQPIAAPSYPTQFSNGSVPCYLKDKLTGTLSYNAEQEIRSDEIFSAQPQLILKTPLHYGVEQEAIWKHQPIVRELSEHGKWDGYLKEIAEAVGKEEEADVIVSEIAELEKEAATALRNYTSGGWAVVWIRSNEIRVYGTKKHAFTELLFDRLGFIPHHNLPKESYRIVTPEELRQINPEKILLLWSFEGDVKRVAEKSWWSALSAVQHDQVYYPASTEWDPWGPIGRKEMINQLVDFFVSNHSAQLDRTDLSM